MLARLILGTCLFFAFAFFSGCEIATTSLGNPDEQTEAATDLENPDKPTSEEGNPPRKLPTYPPIAGGGSGGGSDASDENEWGTMEWDVGEWG